MTARERRQHAAATLNALTDAVLTADLYESITSINHTAELLTGWSRDAAMGRPLADVVHIVRHGTDAVLIARDGHETPIERTIADIRDANGQKLGAVIVLRDAGAAREAVRQLSHLAEHDSLTGLPNRLLLNDRLTAAIALAERRSRLLAVLFLDVDGFKAVNDSLGHAAGDTILRSIATRLRSAVRRSDTVSRHSGDEFVILLPEIERGDDAALVAGKLVRAASGPHRVDSRSVRLTASVGVALYPDDGRDAETLISHADAAMYDAKRRGSGGFRPYTPDVIVALDTAARTGPRRVRF